MSNSSQVSFAGDFVARAATEPLWTNFQSPTRMAPDHGVTLCTMRWCGVGAPCAIVGQASRPSSGCGCSKLAPAMRSSVG